MIPLYRTNPYLFNHETVVDSVITDDQTQLVTCRELIFAEGGGQPRDWGTLSVRGNSAEVLELVKHKGDTRIRIRPIDDIKAGDLVLCSLDTERRNRIMRLHTAQHSFAGALRRILPEYDTRGMKITEDTKECRMVFGSQEKLSESRVCEAFSIIEAAKQRHAEVKAETFNSAEEAQKSLGNLYRPSDQRVQIKGKVRVIIIEDLDANACGGTHVRDLSEIGDIKVLQFGIEPETGSQFLTIG